RNIHTILPGATRMEKLFTSAHGADSSVCSLTAKAFGRDDLPLDRHVPRAQRTLAGVFLRSSRARLVHGIRLALYAAALASVITSSQPDSRFVRPAHADGNGDGRYSDRAGLLAFRQALRRAF